MSNHERSSGSKEKSPTLQDRLKQIGGRKLLIAAVVAGGLVVGGLAFSNMNKGQSTENSQNQTQSQQEELSLEEMAKRDMESKPKLSLEEIRAKYDAAMPTGEQITEKFRIPSGLSDEELAATFADRLTEWMKCGYDPLLRDEYLHESTSRDTFVDNRLSGIAASCEKYITQALFSKEALQAGYADKFIKKTVSHHAYNLDLAVLTDDKSAENGEHYQISYSPRKVTNETPSGVSPSIRTLYIPMLQKANTDKNQADEKLGATDLTPTGKEQKLQVTFTDEGKYSVISGFVEY